jgi:type III secretory pathway lipoprotein EscJ
LSYRLLTVCLLLLLTGCKEQIVHNLSEVEANRLLTRLHEISIEASKERQPDGKWLIATSKSDSLRAIKYLNDSRVFRQELAQEDGGASSILLNKDEQRARAARRLAREIEMSLRSIEGVLESHVHLNLPAADPLFGQRAQGAVSTASVVAVVDANAQVAAADIAQLVSGATGVEQKSVAVLLTPGVLERADAHFGQAFGVSEFNAQGQSVSPNILVLCAVALCLVGTGLSYLLWKGKITLPVVQR